MQINTLISKLQTFVAGFFLAALFCLPVSAGNPYFYDTENVELSGILKAKNARDANGKRENFFVLVLNRPIEVVPKEGDEVNEPETQVTELQIVNTHGLPLASRKNQKLTLQGSLFHSISAHHHTRVLMEASAVKAD